MKQLLSAGLVLAALPLLGLSATPAEAKPRKAVVTMDTGTAAAVQGVGCERVAVRARFHGTEEEIVSTVPAILDPLESNPALVVDDVIWRDGLITWLVRSGAAECAESTSAAGLRGRAWSAPEQDWELRYLGRRYVARVVDSGYRRRTDGGVGVQSFAGLPVARLYRRGRLTIRAVERAFGRARSKRLDRWGTCHARWPRIGFTGRFVNYGLNPPCRQGFLQEAAVTGRRAKRWAVAVDNIYGVVAGTSQSYMRWSGYRLGDLGITLATKWVPYGGWRRTPSATATLGGWSEPRIDGFEFYIGAGGD